MYDFIFWVTDAVVMAPISDVKSSNGGLTNAAILSVPDMSEQRQWWQLEEVSGQLSSWVKDQKLYSLLEEGVWFCWQGQAIFIFLSLWWILIDYIFAF